MVTNGAANIVNIPNMIITNNVVGTHLGASADTGNAAIRTHQGTSLQNIDIHKHCKHHHNIA